MYIILTVFIIIVSVLLSVVVLIQNPKGGGVNATFSGASQQLFGASRSSDVVEKTTWTLAILLMVFTLSTAFFIKKSTAVTGGKEIEKSEVEKRMNETGGLNQPIAPVQSQPQQQPAGQPQQAPAQAPAK